MDRNNRGLWIVLAVLGGIVLLVPLLTGGMMGAGMMGSTGMMGGVGGIGWGGGLALGLGGLAMLAFWGALVIGAILLVRWLSGPPSTAPSGGGEAPLDILQRRYASGELTREQYDEMRRVLHDEAL